jgi:hypothetical protein
MIGIAEAVVGLLALATVAVLGWFVWSVFLRKYWRVVRIRHARDRREMRQAAIRGQDLSHQGHEGPHEGTHGESFRR